MADPADLRHNAPASLLSTNLPPEHETGGPP